MKPFKLLIGLAAALLLVSCGQKKDVPDAEVMTIAKEAYMYGYPMVKNYKMMYASAIDAQSPDYKKPFNELYMDSRVDTPADNVKETASNDTPYGGVWMDLRREPLVLTVPSVEDSRYYSVQFTDLYAYNFDYVGTRASGNKGGKFLIVGPGWKGEKPEGIDRVIHSGTQFAYGLVRVQLMSPDDMPNVEKIHSQFAIQPFSQFLGKPAPATLQPIKFPAYSDEKARTPEFFAYLNFMMQFGSPSPDEAEMMKRFEKISVGVGKQFAAEIMPEAEKKAYQSGIDGAIADLDAAVKGDIVKNTDMHGTREEMKNNYMNRAYGAMTDLYGASSQEILKITYKLDSEFKVLNGAHYYAIRFEKDKMPPTNAFWSLTLYNLPDQLLVDNPIKRYYINSSMASKMVSDPTDGSVTVFIQKVAPGSEPLPVAPPPAPVASATPAAAPAAAPQAATVPGTAAASAQPAAPATPGKAAAPAVPPAVTAPGKAAAPATPAAAPAAASQAAPVPVAAAPAQPAAPAAPGKAAPVGAAPAPAAEAPKPVQVIPALPSGSLVANWLPASAGDFYMVMRIYIPKAEALNGTWKEPGVLRYHSTEPATPVPAKPGETPAAASTTTAPDDAAKQPAASQPAPAQPVVPVAPATPAKPAGVVAPATPVSAVPAEKQAVPAAPVVKPATTAAPVAPAIPVTKPAPTTPTGGAPAAPPAKKP